MCILLATICAGLIFGSGTEQQPPAPCWLAALAPCSPSPVHLQLPPVTRVGHLRAGAALCSPVKTPDMHLLRHRFVCTGKVINYLGDKKVYDFKKDNPSDTV